MTDKFHVFLSYSRRDTEAMQSIRDDLRAEGLTVWTDENLEIGTPIWQAEIDRAIQNAHSLVVILSPDSCQSEWVIREIQTASDYRIRIFPILVNGDERSAIPLVLRSTQRVDARKDYHKALYQLAEEVAAYCGIETATKQRLKAQTAEQEARQQEKQAHRDQERQRRAAKILEQRGRQNSLRLRRFTLGGMLGLALVAVFLSRGGAPRRITANARSVQALSYSPDGALIAAVVQDEMRFWDAASLQEAGALQASEAITSFLFEPDTQTVITTSEGDVIQAWDLATFTERYFISVPDLIGVAIAPEQSLLAACRPEQVGLYELASGQSIHTVGTALDYATLAFGGGHDSGDLLLVMAGTASNEASYTGQLLSWNVTRNGDYRTYARLPGGTYSALTVNPADTQVYALRQDGETGVLFDIRQEAFIAEVPAEEVLGFTPDGAYALFVQDDRVQALDAATGVGYASVDVRVDAPLALDPRHPRFAYVTRQAGEPQYSVHVYDLATKTASLVAEVEARPGALAFSPAEPVLAIALPTGDLQYAVEFYSLPGSTD